jgi:hypothetical protein
LVAESYDEEPAFLGLPMSAECVNAPRELFWLNNMFAANNNVITNRNFIAAKLG